MLKLFGRQGVPVEADRDGTRILVGETSHIFRFRHL